jgi:hypothetical protein
VRLLTVDSFRKLPQNVEKGGSITHSIFDRYTDSYLKRIGKDLSVIRSIFATIKIQSNIISDFFSDQLVYMWHALKSSNRLILYGHLAGTNVLAYVDMVCSSLRNSIPKSIVYCQVREAKRSLLDPFLRNWDHER